MAFQKPKPPPQFADLKGVLAQTKETDNPLYQVVEQVIERLTQLKLISITEEKIKQIIINNPLPPPVIIPPEELPPGAHAITHEPGGSDPLHVDAAVNVGSLRTLGTGPLQAAPGNDPRFTTPAPHASTHNTGGSDPITALAETVITDGALLARNAANEVITGFWSFQANLEARNVNPLYAFWETDGPTNAKYWRFIVDGGVFNLQTFDDALGSPQTVFSVGRTGSNIDSINFFTSAVARTTINPAGMLIHSYGLRLAGRAGATVSGDQTAWNPVGLGTVYNIAANPTVPLTIRGILAQPGGLTFVLSNASTNIITITHNDGAAGANGIITPLGATISMGLHTSITLMYDAGYGLWRVIGKAL